MKVIKEDFRVWDEESINNQNALASIAKEIKKLFDKADDVNYTSINYDIFDYGNEIVIKDVYDPDDIGNFIEDELGFPFIVKNTKYGHGDVYVDTTQEYEDEDGDIHTRVSREYLDEKLTESHIKDSFDYIINYKNSMLESKNFKYSDEDEVEYKGYIIAPFTINNIKVGNKSIDGFTKYFIKKGDAYYKDKDFTSVEDAKKFIDSAIKDSTNEDYTNSTYTNGNYTLKILNKVKPGEYGVNNAYNVEWNGNKQKLSAEGISMVIRHNKMHKISDSATKVKESIEYDFEDITNMSDAKIILKKYGIDLIKKDSRNYILRKDGKEYTFYVLDNPNEVRKDLVKAVNKLIESINEDTSIIRFRVNKYNKKVINK